MTSVRPTTRLATRLGNVPAIPFNIGTTSPLTPTPSRHRSSSAPPAADTSPLPTPPPNQEDPPAPSDEAQTGQQESIVTLTQQVLQLQQQLQDTSIQPQEARHSMHTKERELEAHLQDVLATTCHELRRDTSITPPTMTLLWPSKPHHALTSLLYT
ncbi:hypothetical protein M231_00837 [Tremella mesenterica]|uniref:Uncharacterized protein n=1 Tax=Tremella mesenterica TaxID=5217 RepID=A0A4Q1BUW5_TREME|nr:hypothetical protein M231_00837 [Tremella mesenterica]